MTDRVQYRQASRDRWSRAAAGWSQRADRLQAAVMPVSAWMVEAIRPQPGQTVKAGDPIAHSGNTGFSTGPHLHSSVFMARNGRERASIPVKFRTAREPALTLLAGHTYQATDQNLAGTKAPAATPFSPLTAFGGGGGAR